MNDELLRAGMTVTLRPHELAMWPVAGREMTVTLTEVGRAQSSDGVWICWVDADGHEERNQFVKGRYLPAILARQVTAEADMSIDEGR